MLNVIKPTHTPLGAGGKIILHINGGQGKCIAATAVCKAIKKQYPNDDLIVITGYPGVFLCYPGIKAYHFNDRHYFYEQYIEGKEYRIMAHNPCLETSFIKGDTMLSVWCDMFGRPYNEEMPKLYINDRESDFFGNQFNTDKPLMVIQTSGGGKDQPNKYSWTRDIPIATAQKNSQCLRAAIYHCPHPPLQWYNDYFGYKL